MLLGYWLTIHLKKVYKKKTINILTVFLIFHKGDVKTFIKLIINYCLKGTRY